MGKKYKKAMTDEAIRREAIQSLDKLNEFILRHNDFAFGGFNQEVVNEMMNLIKMAQSCAVEVEHLARKGYAIFKRKMAQVTITVPAGAIPLNEFQKMVKGQQAADPAVKAAKKSVDADYKLHKDLFALANIIGGHLETAFSVYGLTPNT